MSSERNADPARRKSQVQRLQPVVVGGAESSSNRVGARPAGRGGTARRRPYVWVMLAVAMVGALLAASAVKPPAASAGGTGPAGPVCAAVE